MSTDGFSYAVFPKKIWRGIFKEALETLDGVIERVARQVRETDKITDRLVRRVHDSPGCCRRVFADLHSTQGCTPQQLVVTTPPASVPADAVVTRQLRLVVII